MVKTIASALSFVSILLFVLLLNSPQSFAQNQIDLKTDWPEVSLNQKSVSELIEGKYDVYVVDFWASWCEPCLESLPYYMSELKKQKLNRWALVAINMDTDKQSALDFLKKLNIDSWVLQDTQKKLANKLGVTSLPSLFFINSKGEVLKKELGFNKKSKINFQKNIAEIKKIK